MNNLNIMVSTTINATHFWSGAKDHRSYLAHPHMHRFTVTVWAKVNHDDRDIEFHDLRDMLEMHVIDISGQDASRRVPASFGGMSCEMLGNEILNRMPMVHRVVVTEDETCGGEVTRKPGRPRVVTLCGSTRFKQETLTAMKNLEMEGAAVLMVGSFMHADSVKFTAEQKAEMDDLHLRKIEMSDEIFVINVGGYIGESTKREIAHAEALGKTVRYLEEPRKPEPLDVRPEVASFALAMEGKLRKNDHKGHWNREGSVDYGRFWARLKGEMKELEEAIAEGDPDHITEEAADVGNFAMMIMDVCRSGRDDVRVSVLGMERTAGDGIQGPVRREDYSERELERV